MDIELQYSPPRWWLGVVATLDAVSPGLAGGLLRAPAHRRQISAAAFAAHIVDDRIVSQCLELAPLQPCNAEQLLSARFESLIGAAYGSCPRSYLSMLRRMGSHIAEPSVYRRLHEICSNPAAAAVAKALRAFNQPSDEIIDIAMGCPLWLLEAGVLPLLKSVRHRDDLIASIDLITGVCPTADERALAASLRAAVARGDTCRFVESWLGRAVFPKPDFALDEAFTHVPDAIELGRLAHRFSNCAKNYRLEVLSGVSMFFICDTPKGQFITHLQRAAVNCPWEYAGTHSPGNYTTAPEVREFAEKRMRDAGIIIRREYLDVPDRWKAIERLSMPFEEDLETLIFGP